MQINLGSYDSSNQFINIMDSIEHSKYNRLCLENITSKVNYNNELIVADYSVLDKYRGLLSNYKVKIEIAEMYFYKPDLLSYDLYGTVDLWYLILFLNDNYSAAKFNKKFIYVFNPEYIHVLNEIIDKEYNEIQNNNKEIPFREDLTLKPINVKTRWDNPLYLNHDIGDIDQLIPNHMDKPNG